MTIMFRASSAFLEIEEVEVVHETACRVYRLNKFGIEQSEPRLGRNARYFEYWNDAHTWLRRIALLRVKSAEDRLVVVKMDLARVNDMWKERTR